MPWPKGQPRKGYIKKDGTAHAPKGARMAQDNTIVVKGPRTQVSDNLPAANVAAPAAATLRIHGETSGGRPVAVASNVPGVVSSSGLAINGATNRPIVEPCPKCGYAYADGGACGECGWTQYRADCPHCKRLGRQAS